MSHAWRGPACLAELETGVEDGGPEHLDDDPGAGELLQPGVVGGEVLADQVEHHLLLLAPEMHLEQLKDVGLLEHPYKTAAVDGGERLRAGVQGGCGCWAGDGTRAGTAPGGHRGDRMAG